MPKTTQRTSAEKTQKGITNYDSTRFLLIPKLFDAEKGMI